ncbi:hypothetical protein [Nesterenkonia alba]|uniref:hypothetical protein n=1 Tax=Nesterenkonia alba TaxID=515814 RepID=UPI0003B3093A|nr:hypothetical protein [Nesterenkonia alba]
MSSQQPRPSASRRRARVRTTPKLAPFFVVALGLAFTAAVITVYSTPPAENYTDTAAVGYMTFAFGLPAVGLAATAWLLTEKYLRRRATTYDMERLNRGRDEGSEAPSGA